MRSPARPAAALLLLLAVVASLAPAASAYEFDMVRPRWPAAAAGGQAEVRASACAAGCMQSVTCSRLPLLE